MIISISHCRSHHARAKRAVGAAALFTGILAIGASGAQPARAASIVNVTTVVDSAAGPCKTTGTGTCTLREAVIFANSHPGSTINVPAGEYVLDVLGPNDNTATTGDLDIRSDTSVIGAGPDVTIIKVKLDSNADRVLEVFPNKAVSSVAVSIAGLTLAKGLSLDGLGGGALLVGASSRVTLDDVVVRDNQSSASGGAIAVKGGGTSNLSILNSTIDTNNMLGPSPFEITGGGGIYASAATLTIVNSVIANNDAVGSNAISLFLGTSGGSSHGGGVLADGESKVSIVSSTIDANTARGGAGGRSDANGSPLSAGDGFGGGVAVIGSNLRIVNSTVSSNSAVGGTGTSGGSYGSGSGGGIYAGTATVLVANNTIVDNEATSKSTAIGVSDGLARGGGVSAGAQTTITNSILARNTINPSTPSRGTDIVNGFTSGGHNLVRVGDGATGYAGSDLTGSAASPLDPKLASEPADNGGNTPTIALLTGSPAINGGDNTVCGRPLPPSAGPNGAGGVDQRGVARPQPAGGACDIGAFEQAFPPTTTALSSSANPADVGQPVTFTALVGGSGTPTGTVNFMDGSTSLGGGTLVGGVLTLTTAALAAGIHSITATYNGDGVTFPPSTSAVLTQTVLGDDDGGGGVGGPTVGLQFFPLPRPVRLLDTRPAHTAFVQPGVALIANQPVALPGRFTADSITIPPEAQALVGNATVDNTAGVPPGFATLWPSGSQLPLASNLNFVQGTVRPNAFTVGLGSDGKFNLLSNTGGHFIIDITGYYAPPAAGGLYFHPLAQPVRLLDTRAGADAVVHPGAPLNAGQTLAINGRFTSNGTTVPASAKALAGNATVDNTINAPPGFATLFPGGTELPPTSNLNFAAGTIAPNAFTVALGTDGTFQLFSNTGGNFIVDVTGYYDEVPAGGLLYHPLDQPARELDTRTGQSAAIHPDAPLAPGGTLTLPGAFTFNGIVVPAGATALLGNATVDNSINAPAGFATLYPAGATLPLASNLNYEPGLVAPNAFIVGIGTGNSYNLFSQSGSNFIIDISGYFAPT